MNAQAKTPAELMADLTDQVRLLRLDVANLSAAHPTKAEAEATALILEEAQDSIDKLHQTIPDKINQWLAATNKNVIAATEAAASLAVAKLNGDVTRAAQNLSKAAGEARREAWRYFGGFWVWLASVGAVGAVLGLLLMRWIDGTVSAQDFGRDYSAKYFCGSAGGTEISSESGRKYCAIPMEPDVK